jgi:C-terminal processing protease CtpA/Prc
VFFSDTCDIFGQVRSTILISAIYRIFKELNVKLFRTQVAAFNSAKHSRGRTSFGLPGVTLGLSMALLLSACGGGSGGGSSGPINTSASTWQSGVFEPATAYENKCAVPRHGTDPSTDQPFLDKKGTLLDEKNFLRSWSNDTYLWYKEIVDVDPSKTEDPLDYFDLLKTHAKTASGNDKDKFHFTYDSLEWYNLSVGGVAAGYGMELSWINSRAPYRNVVVAYTEPGSPAAAKNVKRGAKIIKVDGYDFINGNTQAIVEKLNAGLFPQALNEVHTFEIQNIGASTTEEVVLTSASITKTPVQNVKVIDTPEGKVGYFVFNDHIKPAERGLYDAINNLKAQNVSDLVLDIRYNGGGSLNIAKQLAYMIAGSKIPSGATFEKVIFNDKYDAPAPLLFDDKAPKEIGGSLPSLNLSRVFVITTGDTCSASESIINGLRGVGVEVIQIGSKTCGKPYGFYPQDNCGTTYFTIQLKGVNNTGFGEYSDGFIPSVTDNEKDLIKGCALGDDLSHQLGDEVERNLATALTYRKTASCTLPTSAASSQFKMEKASVSDELSDVSGTLNKPAGLTNRIMN